MAQHPRYRVKRVYDAPDAADGRRVLVDRLWPRGISKTAAHIDEWAKDVTPSTELRKWMHEDPDSRRVEFERRYRAELSGRAQQEGLARLRAEAAEGPLTLITAVKDEQHSHLPTLLAELGETPEKPRR
ncbi:DUF488 domain-containing protein [Nocardia huaxiensis]|uniref:DUF488 family protein n=1 Tax=Nocardia huaxiensis TaxID=2755382 RepID=A0A7D6ZFX8_9NOCA|nr:DUF488 family protein [Nocardia huaxiensis]QLY32718.1 DUF488 family protein [Nocardia huaxiensis]UFS93546.1 DUF488 family protein [Nocardia huaxiensis]